MKKATWIGLPLVCIVLTLGVVVFFGPWIQAKVFSFEPIRNLRFFSPQSPIVINTREEVRVSDTNDAVEAIANAKSKVSTLFFKTPTGNLQMIASAINVGSDGVFVTTTSPQLLANKSGLQIKLSDNQLISVTAVTPDNGSSLVLLSGSGNNIPTVSFTDSRKLAVGQRVVTLGGSLSGKSTVTASFKTVSSPELLPVGLELSADKTQRSVGIDPITNWDSGPIVFNLSGEVVGIWDGARVISSSTIQNIVKNYYKNSKTIKRVSLGFQYRTLPTYASNLGKVEGVEVLAIPVDKKAKVKNPAENAGLKVGDIITELAGAKINEEVLFDRLLEELEANTPAPLKVVRGSEILDLSITPISLE